LVLEFLVVSCITGSFKDKLGFIIDSRLVLHSHVDVFDNASDEWAVSVLVQNPLIFVFLFVERVQIVGRGFITFFIIILALSIALDGLINLHRLRFHAHYFLMSLLLLFHNRSNLVSVRQTVLKFVKILLYLLNLVLIFRIHVGLLASMDRVLLILTT